MILIYITNPSKGVAQDIAKSLLKRRLAACCNIIQSESLYWWEEKIRSAEEWVLIAKTKEKYFGQVCTIVTNLNPYETPCIIKIPSAANEPFEKLIDSTCPGKSSVG